MPVHRDIQPDFSMKAKSAPRDFPVVCVGGSAGGLDAYIRLLQNLPADLGVAIVIVNHLRTVATMLHKILPKYTTMPVELITDDLVIEPNHVFIIPEKRDLHVLDGEFRLEPISKPRGWPDVITVFLRSLTANWEGKLIAVIVSGYDGDGAAALCGIKEVGGITIAQRLDTATQPDMPVLKFIYGILYSLKIFVCMCFVFIIPRISKHRESFQHTHGIYF